MHDNLIARQFFKKNGVRIKPKIIADQEGMLAELVAMEEGITLMREDIALTLQNNEKLYIWPKEKTVGQLFFLWDKEKENSPIISGLIEIIRGIWKIPN